MKPLEIQSFRGMYSFFPTIFILTLFFRYSLFISMKCIDNHEQQNTPLKSIADSGFEFQNSQKERNIFSHHSQSQLFPFRFFFLNGRKTESEKDI